MSDSAVVVVGGGLAGITATCELLELGCNVTILEKMRNLGGNSSKATCGIAVPGSSLQAAAGIQDDGSDLLAGGALAEALVKDGAKDVEWLTNVLAITEELVLRKTPGHQVARTIGTKTHFPGMVVTYKAIEHLKRIAAERPSRLKLVTSAEVTKIVAEGSAVKGVEYTKDGSTSTALGPVIIATGGYVGDNSASSVLAKNRPDLLKMPTTNDERARGDGIKLGAAIGAKIEGLDDVQIVPNAMVTTGHENEQLKFVASTTIFGAGGVIVNSSGARFTDESKPAKEITLAMQKAKPPFRLIIGEEKAKEVEWFINFYVKNGMLQKFKDVAELAKAMRASASTLKTSVGAADSSSALYSAVLTPALYSCSGGLVTDTSGAVKKDGSSLTGLYAAGEVTSASAKALWELSGVPLLYCVYSGRQAGRAAAEQVLQKKPEQRTDLRQLILAAMTGMPEVSQEKKEEKPLEELSKEELIERCKALMASGPPAQAADSGPPPITMEDVGKHNKKDDAWLVVAGDVLDVTKWIPIHPGGEQAICSYLGMDATEEWNMIHKPGTVEKNMQHITKIGKLGSGGGGGAAPAAGGAAAPAADGIPLSEVQKHNTKADAWIVVNGQVLDVTKWIPVHPGGEKAVEAYLGADSSEEWNTIHKPNMVEKNAFPGNPNGPVVVGKFAGGSAAPAPVAAGGDDEAPPPDGDGGIPGIIGAVVFLGLNVARMILRTVFFTGNIKISLDNNRNGTIRSAIFLLFFTIVHSLGNFMDLIVNNAPEEVNGEGFTLDERLAWTGYGIDIVEEYLALALLLHVLVALKRSWDISINYCIYTGRWNMLISGLIVLAFLIKHLLDIRFYQHYNCAAVWPPQYYVHPTWGHIWSLAPDSGVEPAPSKDVYTREYELFTDLGTNLFYTLSVVVFMCHMCWGWKKLVPSDAFQIPKEHVNKVTLLGQALAFLLGSMYLSLPWFVYFTAGANGEPPLQVVRMPCPGA